MTAITSSAAADLLSAWATADSMDSIAEDEVTASAYAEMTGLAQTTARELLLRRVRDGSWQRRRVRINGSVQYAYKPVISPQ